MNFMAFLLSIHIAFVLAATVAAGGRWPDIGSPHQPGAQRPQKTAGVLQAKLGVEPDSSVRAAQAQMDGQMCANADAPAPVHRASLRTTTRETGDQGGNDA
jgi:FlaG/FlaF family flagellin (archaellin)